MTRNSITTQAVQSPRQEVNAITSKWLRLPRSGYLCPHSGLSRSKLNDLILGPNPPVRSVCLRKRGQGRGTRLISYDSLMEFLNGLNA